MDPITLSLGAKALGLLKRFWPAIPVLLAVAWLGWQVLSLRGENTDLKELVATLIGEKAQLEQRNATTQASLDGALIRIDLQNLEAEGRAKRLKADGEEAKATEAQLRERYRTTAGQVEALRRAARDGSLGACTVSPEALEALKEL